MSLCSSLRLRHDHTVQSFRTYVNSANVVAPARQKELLHKLGDMQAEFQERRIQVSQRGALHI